jgi:heat shock protein HslJ
VTGSTGCNTFGGPFERSGDRLRFGELISTRMACVDPAAARQEQALVSALDATERFTISGDRLTLYGGDRPLAVFRAEPGG